MGVGTSYSENLNAMGPRTCNASTQEAQTGLKLAWTSVRAFLKKKKRRERVRATQLIQGAKSHFSEQYLTI